MAFGGTSYLAILVAAVAGFAFGGVYYAVLGRRWMAALGKTQAELGQGGKIAPFVVAAVAQLVIAFVLAGAIGHLGPGQVTVRNGLVSGAILWAGLVMTTMAVNHRFQGSKLSLTAIDGGHWLGVLLVQGLIIGLIGA
ncbi:MAG: DUF1761 domain-containing protein [Rhodospirillaceae bacterium]